MLPDNIFGVYEFAFMARIIELGKRFGLQPWQIPINYNRSTGETIMTGTPTDPVAYGRFMDMLKALGVPEHDSTIPNEDEDHRTIPYEEGEEMFEAIDKAMKKAPRKWTR